MHIYMKRPCTISYEKSMMREITNGTIEMDFFLCSSSFLHLLYHTKLVSNLDLIKLDNQVLLHCQLTATILGWAQPRKGPSLCYVRVKGWVGGFESSFHKINKVKEFTSVYLSYQVYQYKRDSKEAVRSTLVLFFLIHILRF